MYYLSHEATEISSLTWIFASNNGIIRRVLDINTGNQLWGQNNCHLKKILMIDVFQIAKAELNEITLKI